MYFRGSEILFAEDGTLIVSVGEGAHLQYPSSPDARCGALFGEYQNIGFNRSQSLLSLGGKILRIGKWIPGYDNL
jgi:glucose/arabinose dehydrogenase